MFGNFNVTINFQPLIDVVYKGLNALWGKIASVKTELEGGISTAKSEAIAAASSLSPVLQCSNSTKFLVSSNSISNNVGIEGAATSNPVFKKSPAIFDWLDLQDINEKVILLLMLLVSVINMVTTLMILIIDRSKMIGILKVLGMPNWGIRKVFLYNASYLIGLGLLWGNLIGLSLLFIQKYFKLFPLNPDTYYVSEAPVYINWDYIILLNIGTFIACLLMLIIPSVIVSKISPVKAIRFD